MAKNQGSGRQQNPGGGLGVAGTTAARTTAASDDDTAARKQADAKLASAKPKTYRAMDRGYVDGRIIEEGEVFSTAAPEGSWMEPIKGGKYGAEEAADDAQSPKPDDVDLEGMDEGALQAMAAERGVSQPGELSKDDLISAIRAARQTITW